MTSELLDSTPSGGLLPEEVLVKISPSPEGGRGLTVTDQDSSESIYDFLTNFTRNGSSSKTSPVSCRLTTDGIMEPSSGRWGNSVIISPDGFWTLNTRESRRDVVESSLSAILEPPGERLRKYFLSPTACQGILRRAAKRGRKLPELLEQALNHVAQQ